jgi:hypothetical protein
MLVASTSVFSEQSSFYEVATESIITVNDKEAVNVSLKVDGVNVNGLATLDAVSHRIFITTSSSSEFTTEMYSTDENGYIGLVRFK